MPAWLESLQRLQRDTLITGELFQNHLVCDRIVFGDAAEIRAFLVSLQCRPNKNLKSQEKHQ